MNNIKEFRVLYDKDADVLYIRAPAQFAERAVEDDSGLVWRYSIDGAPLGCVVQDFTGYCYPKRQRRLASEISVHLDLPEHQVEKILSHAISD
jgi:hypothetical protein